MSCRSGTLERRPGRTRLSCPSLHERVPTFDLPEHEAWHRARLRAVTRPFRERGHASSDPATKRTRPAASLICGSWSPTRRLKYLNITKSRDCTYYMELRSIAWWWLDSLRIQGVDSRINLGQGRQGLRETSVKALNTHRQSLCTARFTLRAHSPRHRLPVCARNERPDGRHCRFREALRGFERCSHGRVVHPWQLWSQFLPRATERQVGFPSLVASYTRPVEPQERAVSCAQDSGPSGPFWLWRIGRPPASGLSLHTQRSDNVRWKTVGRRGLHF